MKHLVAQEGLSSNKAPLFFGYNYTFWKLSIEEYLMALGFEVWQLFVEGYEIPKIPPRDRAKRLVKTML